MALKQMETDQKTIEECLKSYKPPIFWKDKDIVKTQIKYWNLERIKKLIFYLNDLEILVKKNNLISVNLLNNFILEEVSFSN